MASRHYLFLQGLRSPFFKMLAEAFRSKDIRVSKINYTLGDRLYWSHCAESCNASLQDLDDFYCEAFARLSPTDLILFGDCRPIHTPAIKLALHLGIRIHVFEEGYFRPDWITLEQTGVNGYSRLPKDVNWYLKTAPFIKEVMPLGLKSSLNARVFHDVAYNIACLANPIFFPNYPGHITYTIHDEYISYVRRAWKVKRTREQDTNVVNALARSKNYFILALQVVGDSQLRCHSQYADFDKLLREVLSSFAAQAPFESKLVIKNHPLDPGFIPYGESIAKIASSLQILDRIVFLETGHLPTLLSHAMGLVTVNSTTIGQALFHQCPVKALGQSIFNINGLCHQGSLESFWTQPGKVDQILFKAFKKVVTHITQINGDLYSAAGISLAVKNAIPRLLEPSNRLEVLMDMEISRIDK
jgi:capsular polysaccharide export protein